VRLSICSSDGKDRRRARRRAAIKGAAGRRRGAWRRSECERAGDGRDVELPAGRRRRSKLAENAAVAIVMRRRRGVARGVRRGFYRVLCGRVAYGPVLGRERRRGLRMATGRADEILRASRRHADRRRELEARRQHEQQDEDEATRHSGDKLLRCGRPTLTLRTFQQLSRAKPVSNPSGRSLSKVKKSVKRHLCHRCGPELLICVRFSQSRSLARFYSPRLYLASAPRPNMRFLRRGPSRPAPPPRFLRPTRRRIRDIRNVPIAASRLMRRRRLCPTATPARPGCRIARRRAFPICGPPTASPNPRPSIRPMARARRPSPLSLCDEYACSLRA
jgi:hypothetical protein